jgi:serine protease inhibitor
MLKYEIKEKDLDIIQLQKEINELHQDITLKKYYKIDQSLPNLDYQSMVIWTFKLLNSLKIENNIELDKAKHIVSIK